MKNILTTLLLLAALTVSAQNYSPCYKEKYEAGVALYNKGDYNGAKAKFVAAKGCPMANAKEADEWIGKCNKEINRLADEKRKVEEQTEGAKRNAEREAAEAKRRADAAEKAKLKAEQEAAEAKRQAEAAEAAKRKVEQEVEEAKRKAEAAETAKRNADLRALAQTYTVKGVSFTMKYVEGGTFTMGCTSEQGGDCQADEEPSHQVVLSAYCIGETEVTQALWKAVMGNNPSSHKGNRLPVEHVSWYDCQEFISKLNRLLEDRIPSGYQFALPTEAQWEYAARGGNKSQHYKYAGGNTIGDVAWYRGSRGYDTRPVKTKQANELGLYDMSGNVSEWCADWYAFYSSSVQADPKGPSERSSRVSRGGYVGSSAESCRVSDRFYDTPDYRFDVGFRLSLVHQ